RLIRREGRRFEQETTLLKFDVAMKGKNDPEIPGFTRYNLIFDQGRPRVAFADPRGRIQVWDWEQRKLVREWEARTEYDETSLSWFSADGRRLVLMSFNSTNRARHYREWEIASGLEKRAIPLPEIGLDNSRWLESSSDGNGFLLLGKGQTESVRYDFAASRYLPLPQLNLRQSTRPKTSPDGRLIFSPSHIGEVRVFDSQSLRENAALRGFMFSARGIAFSEDGQRLITGSTAQEVATLWDLRNFERLLTLPTSASASGYVGISPDGNVLVGDAGRTMFFWRAPSLEEIAKAEAALAAEERNISSP
ncbi:MAG: WD40 repeat domain-containing protein, partial [Opitutaceae bacterium]